MDRPKMLSLLRAGHDEITLLRRQIAALEPKAHAYDTIAQMAALTKHPSSQGYGEDVAWRMKAAVEALVAEREAEKAPLDQGSGQ